MKVCESELFTVGPAASRILLSNSQRTETTRGQQAKEAWKQGVREAQTHDIDAVGARSPICRKTASYANSW